MARARRGINVRQFAERQGWDGRNVYRDIETLRAAAVPIEHPEHGWYSLPENWLPPATADIRPDELMALSVARQLAPGLRDTAIGRALDSLWGKLSTPGHQPSLAFGDETWFHTCAPAVDYGPHQVVLDAVRESARTRRALRIQYRKSGGEPSERTIEPSFVHWDPAAEALYVYAWCRKREMLRMFAIHRIGRAELTDEHFAPRREAAVEMGKAFRSWPRNKVERIALRFSPRVAGEIRERQWHRTARLTESDDGGIVLEMDIGAPEELERWLMGYGPDVVVEAPIALAERIRARHADAAVPERLGLLRARPAASPGGPAAARAARSKP
jgi:predicted DNA-binding transcriptional regulator YafY